MPPVGFEPTISAGVRPAAVHLLKSWVRIPPGAWIFVCCECRVLSGRGLCDELITRPEESYRLCCVVVCDLETSRMGAPYIYDISRLRVKLTDLLKDSKDAELCIIPPDDICLPHICCSLLQAMIKPSRQFKRVNQGKQRVPTKIMHLPEDG